MLEVRSRPAATPAAATLHRCIGIVALVMGVGLIGCSTGVGESPPPSAMVDDSLRSRLIATDFAAALARLPAPASGPRRLTTGAPDSRFAILLLGALQDAGYELRVGNAGEADQALDRLAWRISPPDDAERSEPWAFTVTAGDVTLDRRYRVTSGGVLPVSAMSVERAEGSGPPSARRSDPEAADRPRAMATAGSAGAGQAAAPSAGGAAAAPNLFQTGVSRHAARLSGHRVLRSAVLVFPNDSLRMGQANKRLAGELVDRFDASRDLLSLIGCSHGATALTNGNERLALGRAARVRDEFLRAGIRADKVLDEGCWAGRGHATLPPRGVVVTHHRRAG